MAFINGGPFKRKKIGRYPGDYSQICQIHLVLSLHLGNNKTENKGTVGTENHDEHTLYFDI